MAVPQAAYQTGGADAIPALCERLDHLMHDLVENEARLLTLTTEHDQVIGATRTWIERAVIGLNLCPFAKAVYVREQIRYVVSEARTPDALRQDLARELRLLADTDSEAIETSLLVLPYMLTDFLAFNDFLNVADSVISRLRLAGVIQIAGFHPQFQFAGAAPEDVTNCTNRSPFPMLHLLREAGVAKAVAAFPDAATIYQKNIETMRTLGNAGWADLRDQPG